MKATLRQAHLPASRFTPQDGDPLEHAILFRHNVFLHAPECLKQAHLTKQTAGSVNTELSCWTAAPAFRLRKLQEHREFRVAQRTDELLDEKVPENQRKRRH